MKKYEAVFILDIRKAEDEGEAFGKELAGLIEGLGGKVAAINAMGRKQFSYEIKKRKAGIYLDLFFELDPLKIADIKEKYHLDERVLRSMIIIDERPEQVNSALKAE